MLLRLFFFNITVALRPGRENINPNVSGRRVWGEGGGHGGKKIIKENHCGSPFFKQELLQGT